MGPATLHTALDLNTWLVEKGSTCYWVLDIRRPKGTEASVTHLDIRNRRGRETSVLPLDIRRHRGRETSVLPLDIRNRRGRETSVLRLDIRRHRGRETSVLPSDIRRHRGRETSVLPLDIRRRGEQRQVFLKEEVGGLSGIRWVFCNRYLSDCPQALQQSPPLKRLEPREGTLTLILCFEA